MPRKIYIRTKPTWNKGKKLSKKHKENISKACIGKPSWNKGKTGIYSEETLEKMSVSRKKWLEKHPNPSGKNSHLYGKTHWIKGKHHSIEAKKKISIKATGRKHSKEVRQKMSLTRRGENSHNWKGGKMVSRGYTYILQPSHPRANKAGYVKRANLIMEKMINRYLFPEELVHHKGIHFPISSIKNKQDDNPENLQLFKNKSAHTRFHFKR